MDWQILVFYPEPEARDKISLAVVKFSNFKALAKT
jgi:hypothetical protein